MGSRVKSALFLLFLLILLFEAGCISPGPHPDVGTEKGFGPALTMEPPYFPRAVPKVSLSDAMAALPAAEQEGGIDIRGMTLRQVFGFGVNSSGLARTWVLGMGGDGRTTLLSYSEGEWRELDVPVKLPANEVKPKDLLSPGEIYRINLDTIGKEMDRLQINESDLSLNESSYEVVILSPLQRSTLSFNAKTGELTATAMQTFAISTRSITPTTAAATPSPTTPGRLGFSVLVPLGAAALAILGSRRRC
jgi:hypothetical protein